MTFHQQYSKADNEAIENIRKLIQHNHSELAYDVQEILHSLDRKKEQIEMRSHQNNCGL